MAQEFLLASAVVALSSRGLGSVVSGIDRIGGALGGVEGAQQRLQAIMDAGAAGMAARQQQLAARIQAVHQAAGVAEEARQAQLGQKVFSLYAKMGGATVAQQERLRQQIAAIHERADLARAAAAQRVALRVQGIEQAAGAAEQAAAQQLAAGMAEAGAGVEAALGAATATAILGTVAAVAALAVAAVSLGIDFERANDAVVELNNVLKVEGITAGGASEKLQAHARALSEFANISRVEILGMEAATLRLGVSAEQAGRAVEIAVGLAKARGVDVQSALHAVNLAIEGREEGLRRLLGLKRGGTGLSGNALLAEASRTGDIGLTIQHASATETYEGAVKKLGIAWEEAKQKIGEAFGPAVLATVRFMSGAVERLGDSLHTLAESDFAKDLGDLFRNLADQIERMVESIAQLKLVAGIGKEIGGGAAAAIGGLGKPGTGKDPLRQERSQTQAAVLDVQGFYDKLITAGLQNTDPQLDEARKQTDHLAAIRAAVERDRPPAAAALAP